MKKTSTYIPDSTFVEMPGLGHIAHIENLMAGESKEREHRRLEQKEDRESERSMRGNSKQPAMTVTTT